MQEKSGSILCKLRFIGHDGNSAATREDSMPVKHRLVSQKQDNRNNLRAKSFKDSKAKSLKQSSDKSKQEDPQGAFKGTRSRSDLSSKCEEPRSETISSPIKSLSPEPVYSTPTTSYESEEPLLSLSDTPDPALDTIKQVIVSSYRPARVDKARHINRHTGSNDCRHVLCSVYRFNRVSNQSNSKSTCNHGRDIHYPCDSDSVTYEEDVYHCVPCEETLKHEYSPEAVPPDKLDYVCEQCMANGYSEILGCCNCNFGMHDPDVFQRIKWPTKFANYARDHPEWKLKSLLNIGK